MLPIGVIVRSDEAIQMSGYLDHRINTLVVLGLDYKHC